MKAPLIKALLQHVCIRSSPSAVCLLTGCAVILSAASIFPVSCSSALCGYLCQGTLHKCGNIYLKAAGFRCRAQVLCFFIDTAEKLYDACKLSELDSACSLIPALPALPLHHWKRHVIYLSMHPSYVAMLYLKSIVITALKPLVQLVCKRYERCLPPVQPIDITSWFLPSEI